MTSKPGSAPSGCATRPRSGRRSGSRCHPSKGSTENAAASAQHRNVNFDLLQAARSDSLASVRKTLDDGADPNSRNRLGDTPLNTAARNGNVFAVDATSYFSRPGPRVVDGVEILGWAIHPEAYPEPPPGTIARIG